MKISETALKNARPAHGKKSEKACIFLCFLHIPISLPKGIFGCVSVPAMSDIQTGVKKFFRKSDALLKTFGQKVFHIDAKVMHFSKHLHHFFQKFIAILLFKTFSVDNSVENMWIVYKSVERM